MTTKSSKPRWWLRGACALGGWLVVLWVAGLFLPPDGGFPWWYSALIGPIYPTAALAYVVLPQDVHVVYLAALMMLFTLAFGGALGWTYGRITQGRKKKPQEDA